MKRLLVQYETEEEEELWLPHAFILETNIEDEKTANNEAIAAAYRSQEITPQFITITDLDHLPIVHI